MFTINAEQLAVYVLVFPCLRPVSVSISGLCVHIGSAAPSPDPSQARVQIYHQNKHNQETSDLGTSHDLVYCTDKITGRASERTFQASVTFSKNHPHLQKSLDSHLLKSAVRFQPGPQVANPSLWQRILLTSKTFSKSMSLKSVQTFDTTSLLTCKSSFA